MPTPSRTAFNTVPAADIAKIIGVPGFLVFSDCGREWFVTLDAVGQDYIGFLMDADGLNLSDARAEAEHNREFWPTWFAEQCTYWEDIERLGLLTKASILRKTKIALDRLRGKLVTEYLYVASYSAVA